MLTEENNRIRWLTREKAQCLHKELTSHLAAMTAFSLASGLRKSNVPQLKCNDIELI